MTEVKDGGIDRDVTDGWIDRRTEGRQTNFLIMTLCTVKPHTSSNTKELKACLAYLIPHCFSPYRELHMLWFLLVSDLLVSATTNNTCTVDGFIFVGTNFRGMNKTDTFLGIKIRGHSIFFHNMIQKITISWILKFEDWTFHENHENWYPYEN